MLKLYPIKLFFITSVTLFLGTLAHADNFRDLVKLDSDPAIVSAKQACTTRVSKCTNLVNSMDDFDGDLQPLLDMCSAYLDQCNQNAFTANDRGEEPYGIDTTNLSSPIKGFIADAYIKYNEADMRADGSFSMQVLEDCLENNDDDLEVQQRCVFEVVKNELDALNEAALQLQMDLTEIIQ